MDRDETWRLQVRRKGGYQLARPPEEISVGDVIRELEGPVFVAACADPDPDFDECGRGDFCVSRLLWTAVSRKIEEAFDSTSFADLCRAAERGPDGARRVLRRFARAPAQSRERYRSYFYHGLLASPGPCRGALLAVEPEDRS